MPSSGACRAAALVGSCALRARVLLMNHDELDETTMPRPACANSPRSTPDMDIVAFASWPAVKVIE